MDSTAVTSTHPSLVLLSHGTENDEASIHLAPLSEHCNYSTRSSYQQINPISLIKGAVRCSRARSLEYFFMKIPSNYFFTGKETKRKAKKTRPKKKKTWCVKRKIQVETIIKQNTTGRHHRNSYSNSSCAVIKGKDSTGLNLLQRFNTFTMHKSFLLECY